ncbi:MAG: hypothetical protein NTX00_03050 [Candidatus Parcubacteria bacterium]|nr:hypothetical protein [Candidatus Parcubacteria bacterium]
MRKTGVIIRVLVFLRILKKKSELDAWMDREERGFPFLDLIGVEVKCGEKTFAITAEMEQTSYKDQEASRGGMGFRYWVVKCPFCQTHQFKIFSSLRVYAMKAN